VPDARGKISLVLTVDEAGSVAHVGASRSGNVPREAVHCVLSIARRARFEPPVGGQALLRVPVHLVRQDALAAAY
jgi:hypothetical protein